MDPLELVFVFLGALVTLLVISAVVRIDQTTRAMLFQLQKASAALLIAHYLVEGPKVKGRPRIVRAGEHQRPTSPPL